MFVIHLAIILIIKILLMMKWERRPNTFTLVANQDVAWAGSCNNSYFVSIGYTIVRGEGSGTTYNSEYICYNASGDTMKANVRVTATTRSGQKLTASMVKYVA